MLAHPLLIDSRPHSTREILVAIRVDILTKGGVLFFWRLRSSWTLYHRSRMPFGGGEREEKWADNKNSDSWDFSMPDTDRVTPKVGTEYQVAC